MSPGAAMRGAMDAAAAAAERHGAVLTDWKLITGDNDPMAVAHDVDFAWLIATADGEGAWQLFHADGRVRTIERGRVTGNTTVVQSILPARVCRRCGELITGTRSKCDPRVLL